MRYLLGVALAAVLLAGCSEDPAERAAATALARFETDVAGLPTVTATARPQPLSSRMAIELETCTTRRAAGSVRNNSASTVDIYIGVVFMDESKRQIGDNLAVVRGVAPGVTASWSASFIDEGTPASCTARVRDAFAD